MEVHSPSHAEAHITKIRHDKGLSETSPSGHNVSDLENALTTLSEQLYQSSTHFLLELIQNADDNAYESHVQPSLHFTYSNGFLRIDCNEVGFSPQNVEALCRVGRSTKKGGDNATGYVGEKGIGFKSVFKAADVVWVSSRYYSFKFDKSKQLGMIAPVWSELPAPIKAGWTSIYLQLSGSYNRKGLLDELRSLDSRLLIFLRRLRNITVSISEPFRKTWKRTFSRTEIRGNIIQLIENNKAFDYIITRHQVTNMPLESKRQGVSSSELTLGFPINEDGTPKRESQQAYAFLPIRDYGFEFLIQADFLLIASREDIDDSSAWNHALRKELSAAFIDTMKKFNQDDKLRYLWPRYLPIREPLQSFLKPFHLDVREKLANESLLFSHSGNLAPPKTLTYVPEEFKFNGTPMTMSPQTSHRCLSARYVEPDLQYLTVIAVKEMSEFAFFYELKTLLINCPENIKAKSTAWHSHLATLLMRLSPIYSSQLGDLALVPLTDGSLVAANGRQILFPANKAEFELPGGLELSVVDSGAASDPERRKLFRFMGVGDLEQEPVVRHIEVLHAKPNSSSIPHVALVSQIKFLYAVGWRNPAFQKLWFTSESGQRFRGSQLYQDSSKPHSATKFFGAHRSKFRFIHKDYLAAEGANRDGWITWLETVMDVATMPRLIQATQDKGFKLSDDFEFIIKHSPSSNVLLLLRDNWEEYSNFLNPDQAKKWDGQALMSGHDSSKGIACAINLKHKLGSLLVTCTNGKKHRLDTTFIPSKELLVASQEDVPFVDIPDANDLSWQVLEALGVSIKVDILFYLRSLERLASEGSDDDIRISELLNMIQLRCDDEDEASTTKKSFGSKSLIYIPVTRQGQRSKWNSLSRCRWKGPPVGKRSQGLRTFDSLKDLYPENRRLFCEILGVQDTNLQDLVHEAQSFAVGDSIDHLTGIFHTMEKLLDDDPGAAFKVNLHALSTYKCFPVSENWELDTDRVSALQDSQQGSEWFVADTGPFRTIFAGVVPLLDIKVDDLPKMDQVLESIALKKRFLSKNASSVPRTQGAVVLNHELTDAFRSKVDFIIRLIHTAKPFRKRRREIIKQLQNLEVYTTDEVIQEWCVSYKGKKVRGPPGNGKVALCVENDVLKIYVAAKSGIDMQQTPMELVDEVFNFCGMLPHNPEHSEMCLHVAFSHSNPSQISKVFADKGIPSLDSLRFAEAEDDNLEFDEKNPPPPRYFEREDDRSRKFEKKSGLLGSSSVVEVALGVPVGILFGLGGLFKSRKHFEGDNKEHDNMAKSRGKTADKKLKVKKTEVHTPNSRPRDGPNGLQKLQTSISKGLLRIQIACSYTSDEDVAFKGELAVHEALAGTLEQNYNPQQHWTSKRRARANLPAFDASPDKHSTFRFSDVGGTFTQLLQDDNYPAAKKWTSRPPTYHLDVKSTQGGVDSEFFVSPAQFQRARDLSIMVQQMKSDIDGIPTDVYILVRVYDVDVIGPDRKGKGRESSNMIFLVDPWECYHANRLILKPKRQIVGSIA